MHKRVVSAGVCLLICALLAACSDNPTTSADRIAFLSDRDGTRRLYVMGADGSQVRRLTGQVAPDGRPSWSPDGGRILFAGEGREGPGLYVMDVNGGKVTHVQVVLPRETLGPYGPVAWSPDGSRVAFNAVPCRLYRVGETAHKNCGEDVELYVVDVAGGNPRRLTDDPAYDAYPSWAPDSSRLAFASDRNGDGDICVTGTGAWKTRCLANPKAREGCPSWSPGGERIAFSAYRDGNTDIYTMNVDGSAVIRLTDHEASDTCPSWSPDGERIAFVSDRDGNREIYAMSADGSHVTRLTDDPADDHSPVWAPR